jgi:hypothetical protein
MNYLKDTLLVVLALLLLGGGSVSADPDSRPEVGALSGHVKSFSEPLPYSKVYAYHLADTSLRKVITDREGNFLIDHLPAGLYKVIAFQDGFLPAIALLSRTSGRLQQYLDLELVEDAGQPIDDETGFWAVREKIPADVLRDLQHAQGEEPVMAASLDLPPGLSPRQIETRMQAVAGLDDTLAYGPAQLTGGGVGIRSEVADLNVGLQGNFVELQSRDANQSAENVADGRTQLVSVKVENSDQDALVVTSLDNRMTTRASGRDPSRVGFATHRVSWSQNVGKRSRSDFSAQYIEENNFYRQAAIQPFGIPEASRAWLVEGSFKTAPTVRSNLETGIRYHQQDSDFITNRRAYRDLAPVPEERVDVFGRGGLQMNPAVLVEIGLFSTLRDGSLAVAPSAGLAFQLGPSWKAYAGGSVQVHDQRVEAIHQGFTPVLFEDYDTACGFAEEYCYQLLLTHQGNGPDELTVGFTHRQFAETLHLYFNEDFFNRLESLFLVRGDNLPEFQFSAARRLTPTILARLESNVAVGGGGTLLADRTHYENDIRYLVTSLDTRFEQTSTAVELVFHHLAQELTPIRRRRAEAPEMELERLQLMLTQDLFFLRQLASDWAVHLNMELSRGGTPVTPDYAAVEVNEDDEVRKRLTGGLAVKF